jgi:protein tyrosine phosphatase (PTP) superfamily phosphohydrolase (DUF442 family)
MFRGSFHWIPKRIGAAIVAVVLLTGTAFAAEVPGAVGKSVSGVEPVELAGIHNAFRIGSRYFSGSAPESDEDFAALAKAGVKTIITVDGAQPDVETAKKHGIRYIHLPHGYDGVSTNAEIQIQKAVATISGPIFFHCHHGKHRGPAAAAIACISTEGWSPETADQWLRLAGTDTNYAGLYRTVETFRPLTPLQLAAIPTNLPEHAKVSGLIDAMVEIDASWDRLKAVRQAGYAVPKNQPDLDPANEATILMEHFREAQRLGDSRRHGPELVQGLKESEQLAKELAALLRERHPSAPNEWSGRLDTVSDGIAQSCLACHREHRN